MSDALGGSIAWGPLASVGGWVRDPRGRFSWLKTVCLVLAILPAAMLLARWAGPGLGPRALNAAIHNTGTWAVRFLLLSLAVTPARWLLDWPRVAMLRRLIGVTAACYAGLHILLYVADQGGDLLHVAAEIALRFYLTIGFVALLGLLALAITSTNGWQRQLGRRWKRLHKLVFPIAVLAIFHHFLQAKADVSDAVFSAGVFLWLVFWRLEPPAWRALRWPLIVLGIGAAIGAAVLEGLWYGLATGISGWRVLEANLDLRHGLRPGEMVAVAAALVLCLALLRSVRRRRPAVQPAG